jgi:hypothetical protein
MPVVTMPNGDLVQFPDTMSRDQIGQFIASKFPGAYDKPEPSLGTIFTDSLARGGENISATLKDDLPAYLASILGQDEYAVEQIEEGRARRQAAAEQYPPQYGSYEDVGSLGDAVGFITEKTSEFAPQLAGLGISALAGAVAAPLVGLGTTAGVTTASLLGSYALVTPESFAGIYEETGTLAPGAASIAGAINSALELVAPAQLLRSFSPSMRRGVVTAILKKSGMQPSIAANAAKGVVKGVVTEGTTEGTQEAVNIAAEKFVGDNPMIFDSEDFKRITESAVAGAAVGFPLGTVGGTGRGFRERGQFAQERRAQEQAEADRLAPETAVEEPAPEVPATTIPADKAALNKWGMAMLGISPNAKILRPDGPLAGKDLTDPAQAVEVKTALEEYLKTAKNEKIINKVKAVIRDLEPTGTFAAADCPAGPVLDETIPEPTVVKKEEPAIDEELATRGFQKTEVQDETVAEEDIPVDRPLWSKDLLGFVTDEYDITEAQAAGLTQTQMDALLADAESEGSVFDGPMVEEQATIIADEVVEEAPEEVDGPSVIDEIAKERDAVFAQQRAELDRRQAELQEENEARVREELKAQEEGRVLEGELVGRAGEATQPRREGITSVLEGEVVREGLPRPALTGSETVTPQETTPAVEDESRVDVIGRAAKKATTAKKPLPTDLFLQLQKQIDKENAPDTRTVKEKKADQKVIRDEALEQADIEQAKLTKGRKPRFGEDALAFRNKELPEKVYRELAVLKAATTPKKEATDGRQILANYLHAYKTPEGALAAIAAESNIDYAENTGVKLATTVVDAQKAGAYINKNMDESVKNAFKKDVDFVTKELDSIERRNAKEKKDAEIRKKSKFGRSKTAEDLKDVGAGTKGAKAVAKKKKEEIGETPEQIAKRIKDEEKARLDAEAESLAELEVDAEQGGTVGFVASIIKNADKIAQETEADLDQKARSNEWVKFIASLPKTKAKTFLDSYTRISKENPNLIPESVRARVVAENKKILSQKDQKRLVKFEEKFLLKTPKYQGPKLTDKMVQQVSKGNLQGAMQSVIAERNKRGDDKNITALINRIKGKINSTSVELDGPEVEAASGAYIPGSNTIVLSTRTGLNEHTLLHESGHAGLAQILNNRNHPTTKKFIEFFDEIKTRVGDAYGGSDIQEFAAEFVSNGEFQALLKQIKAPNGDSLWTRVIKVIAEFFGLRKTDTAYDTTLKFLNDLLDVSQGIEPTLADTLYLGNGNVDQVMDDVAETYLSRSTEDALDAVSRLESDKGRVWALGTASLGNMQNMFGETSPRYKGKNPLPIGTLLAAIERKRGEVNTAIDRTSKNIREMSKAERDATPAQRQAFNDIAIEARLESVDFLKPLPKNAGPKKAAAHKKLNNRFNQLPKPLQASYRTLRKELDTFLEEYVELISQLLPKTAASNLMKDFAQLEGVIAYVPFERTGEYWIRYKDPDNLDSNGNPKETPRALASPRKREIEIAKLKAKHGQNFEVQQYDNLNSISVPKGLPEGQFVTKLVGEMRNNNVDPAIVEQVYQQYVSMFPENSLMQQFKKSKNDPGMDRDIITAYSNVAIKWANKIANTRYNPQIETAMQEIRRVQKEYHGGDKNMAAAAKALTMQEGFFLNPRVAPWAANLTFASYFEYILGSVSSAVVNLTGLMFMVTPMLGARTTYTKAGDAMLLAGKLAASKNWREGKIEGELSKYKNLYRELDNRGLLQHTVAREALERGKTKGKDFDGVFYKTVKVLSTPFAASEKYMRATTAIAAYDLAMANGIPSENVPANNEQAAIDFAAKMVRDAHTGGMAETMPRWLQNDFGRVVWTFKNIVFQQAYVLATAMKQAFLDSDLPPEVKRVARRQVMGTFGLSFALLGGKGLPFFGALTTVMSIFDAIFGDDEEPYDPRVELNDTFGEFFYTGVIGSLLNINISERAALARDIVWRDDPKSIEDYGYLRTGMMALGGPMFSYGIGVEKALTEDFPQGRYMRGFEGLSPTFFRNGLKSIRYMEEGARNRDGDPIDTDINAWNLMTQAIGFTPADLSNTYEQRSSAKNFENKVLQRKQRILNKYKTAKKMGDKALQEEAVKEAREFRRKFPTLMDDNTLERSYKASVRVDREDTMAGITFTKGLRYKTEEFFE